MTCKIWVCILKDIPCKTDIEMANIGSLSIITNVNACGIPTLSTLNAVKDLTIINIGVSGPSLGSKVDIASRNSTFYPGACSIYPF